jgi:hypothetical protein
MLPASCPAKLGSTAQRIPTRSFADGKIHSVKHGVAACALPQLPGRTVLWLVPIVGTDARPEKIIVSNGT